MCYKKSVPLLLVSAVSLVHGPRLLVPQKDVASRARRRVNG